jgi:predicted dinucleotide-binding enzyme
MRIGIVGAGTMARVLATRWAELGHELMVSSRSPARARAVAEELGRGVRSGTFAEAAAFGEVVLVAVRWEGVLDAVEQAGPLDGKVLIDPNNLVDTEGWALQVGFSDSFGEQIARRAPGARVVKAFNTVFSTVLQRPGAQVDGRRTTLFLAGDDPAAKEVVAGLGSELGLDPIDCGPLTSARLLEPLAALIIRLVWVHGLTSDIAMDLVLG